MADRNINLRITGDASGVATTLNTANKAIKDLTGGMNRLNAQGKVISATTGQFARATEAMRTAVVEATEQSRRFSQAQASAITATKAGVGVVGEYKAAIAQMTGGQVFATRAGLLYNSETQKTVTVAQAAKMAVQQFRLEQEQLKAAMAQATAGLTRNEAALLQQRVAASGMANSVGAGSIALTSLTQGLQDASQFGMGMSQGIRAITNNIQSMATALAYASATAGGFAAAMRNMWTAIKGPFGALLAVSLLTAGIEFLSLRNMKAAKATRELAEAEDELAKSMAALIKVVEPPQFAEIDVDKLKALRDEANLRVLIADAMLQQVRLDASLRREPITGGMGLAEAQRALSEAEQDAAALSIRYDEASAALDRHNRLKRLGVPVEEESNKKKERELTLLQKLQEETRDLNAAMSEWATNGLAIAREEGRIRNLERELELLQALRRFDAAGLPRPSGTTILASRGTDTIPGTPLLPPGNIGSTIGGGQRAELRGTEWVDNYKKGLDEAAKATEAFSQSIANSMVDAATTFSAGIGQMIAGTGEFSNVGQIALAALADTAVSVGRVAIGTGFAVLGIKKALETLNPWVAIAAGTALVALGTAVGSKLKAASRGSSGVSSASGGSSMGAAPGLLIGTSGNVYSFAQGGQRNLFGFSPASGLGASVTPSNRVEVFGTMTAQGRELVTVIRNEATAQRRQGVANPLGI